MKTSKQLDEAKCCRTRGVVLLCTVLFAICAPTTSAFSQESAEQTEKATHLDESVRSTVNKVVVIAGHTYPGQQVTGSYEKPTDGLVAGIDSGSRIGTISREVGGIPISIPIPILTIPGAIFGGLSGAAKREIQEFRDALTEQLAGAGSETLSSNGLAEDVYFGLRNLPHLEAKIISVNTPMPENTDAVLYVGLNDITIDVQGKEAILTTSASATLRRASDGWALYSNVIHYQDRDVLRDWTANDNALWRDYINYARHYLGREIAAEVFDKVVLRRELQPTESETVERVRKNDWHGETRSTTPTLAWNLKLLGGDDYGAWTESINETDIFFDIEVYDAHRLVYAEYQFQGASHTLAYEIEDCQTYRWSVRPAYRIDGQLKFGEWMRSAGHSSKGPNGEYGMFGEAASDGPAFTRHFASLDVGCARR